MAKAINWPLTFREEILSEDCDAVRSAFRLGNLYYDNQYWTPNEVVDIRVNHLKVRKAVIVGELEQYPLGRLPDEILAQHKSTVRTQAALLQFLKQTYPHEPVNEQTLVTVVHYKNRPIVPEEVEAQDDPHL